MTSNSQPAAGPPGNSDAAQIQAKLQEAVALHQKGQLGPAQAIYQEVLTRWPRQFDALHLSGIIASQTKNHTAAVKLIGQALEVNPHSVPAHFNLGLALAELKQFGAAVASYDRALRLKPDYAEAHTNRAAALREMGDMQAALESFSKAISSNPGYVEAYLGRGNALRSLGRFEAAVESFDQAVGLKPDFADAYFCRGLARQSLRQYEAALASFDKALAVRGPHAEIYCSRGLVLRELERYQAALEDFDRALALKPDYAEVHSNRGIVLGDLGRYQDAIDSHDRAIQCNPRLVEAYINRGAALAHLSRLSDAVASYEEALALKPDHAGAHNNRGVALFKMRQYAAAVASYDAAIKFQPDHADAYSNRGFALKEMREAAAALASFDKAVAIDPGCANAHAGRGDVLADMKELQAAVDSYDKALQARPDQPFLPGTRLHAKMQICNWAEVERDIAELAEKIARGEQVAPSFPVLSLTDSLSTQRKAAAIWAQAKCPPNNELGQIPKIARHDKIRVGYYSADFHNHATAYLMAGLFESHDRARFAFYGFSFGPDLGGDMRPRIAAAFDTFIDVRARSDSEVAALSRALEIDIAVDLKGFTQDARMGIFSRRAAPVQVSYIGYPGTMAVDYLDYIIADPVVIPEAHRAHYAEKVVHLPGSYQVNDAKREIAERTPSRAELGLPAHAFVFCCFNNNYKFQPATFDVWMRILKRVDGSVLWLFEDNAAAAFNLRGEAKRRGVDPARLVFAGRMPAAEHLARHRAADLFLDTLPYNAHTTASDALWTGLPVITCPGHAFAARVAASLLTAIEMPELIAATASAYEELAVALATDPARLGAIREKLARNRLTTLLFDTTRFARHIEDAYAQMFERYHAGLPPDHIQVRAV